VAIGVANRALPDGARGGDLENLSLCVKEFVQIGEENIAAHVVDTEILNGKERGEINLAREGSAGGDLQWRVLRALNRCEEAAAVAGNFKAVPGLVAAIAQLDIASGEVGNRDRGKHRLVSNILQTAES